MADVAARALSKANVFLGRVVSLTIYDNSSPTPFKTLWITGLDNSVVSATEEVSYSEVTLENGTKLRDPFGRKVVVESTISELSTTDIATINAGKKIVFTTSAQTFTVDAPDVMYAAVDGLKTKITVKKSTVHPTLPYAIAPV